jgi:hypothetical protein
MGKKKNTPHAADGTGLPALRIGSRVRCTADGVEGRIAWANAVSVKIRWDDGEEVTWKRADLAAKPIAFLDAEPVEQPTIEAAPKQPAAAETTVPEPGTPATPEHPTAPEATTAERAAAAPAAQAPMTPAPSAVQQGPDGTPTSASEASGGEALNATLPVKRQRKPKTPAEPEVKKPSAIDAAAKVLAEAGQPMSCKEMIGTMAAKGYWSSPGGKTPDATLHSAILREVAVKGEQSRFVKTGPGRFAARLAAQAPEPAGNAI